MRDETSVRHARIRSSFLLILVLAAAARSAMSAHDPVPDPVMDRMDALRGCLPEKYSSSLKMLSRGLSTGWPRGDAPPDAVPKRLPPPDKIYLESLDRDIEACRFAIRMTNPHARDTLLSVIAKDTEIKALDCRKWGMGRTVKVSIRTMLSGAVSNGWQVYYKWTGASLLQAQELPFPTLTSPAVSELPPGVYVIRVEKRGSPTLAKDVPPVTIVVGSDFTKEVEIVVP